MEIIIIICVVVLVVAWLAYEMIMAPLMPDDYGLTNEELKEVQELEKKDNNKKRKKDES